MRCQQGGSEPWRIGVLFSQTGVMAVIEETQLRATLLAIDEINECGGVNGRQLVPVILDPQSEAQAYALCAKRLMVENEVTTIFGCYTSSSRKAVLPVVERLNGLLWYPTLYEGFEFSPNVIYTGAAPNQNSVALCSYLAQTYGHRFYFIGSDYVYPRESNRLMRELLRGRGCVVAGETYLDLRSKRSDFGPVIRQIKDSGADVIFSTVVGYSTVYLYQAYADAGLNPKTTPIASLTTTESEVRAMGFDAAAGHLTAAPYFQSVRGEHNDRFVRRYKARYGEDEPTNMCAEAAYFQVHLFANALAQTNSMETDIIKQTVLGSDFDAPQGRVSVSAATSHTNLWSRIGRVGERGQFEIVQESAMPVWADPFLVARGDVSAMMGRS
ncbi:MAG: transporter substrate-binding domain-containing protein [Bradyrhizobiaceae bacterium]|nr:transporter substrate-binding domain-containing protein [Bradyrhizobiaceae bacterium]